MYTASSVKTALKNVTAGKGYHFERLEHLNCPATAGIYAGKVQRNCCGDYRNCYEAHSRTCRQPVHICRNTDRGFKRILNFYFTVSDDSNEGFIDERDIILRWVMDDLKLIDEKDLVRA
jgi:hypothetical protein